MLARRSWQTWCVSERRERLAAARLYLVCDARGDEFLRRALDGGVDIVQLRCKTAPDDALLAAGTRFARVCKEFGALLIINDRPDLVAQVGADGVHLGQDDMSPAGARSVLGDERIVGLSTHTPPQIDQAGVGVDYIGVGPVYATPTKPGRSAVGVELVAHAAAHAQVPFFAIGGIDAENVAAVHGAGARRIAVVRALTEADDPRAAARVLREALKQRSETGARVGAT
jgi:thiamine-phosphate pyrophosphorylase